MTPLSPATPHLALPMLAPAQASKHITINESLLRLDRVTQLSVTDTTNSPPDTPEISMRVRVGAEPQDIFSEHPNAIAEWSGAELGWTFLKPQIGWRCCNPGTTTLHVFNGTKWVLLSNANPESISINTTVDPNNRLSVRSDAALFDTETGSVRLGINRAASGDVASIVFQTDYAGEIEIGLAGSSGFVIRTSPDGQNWSDALTVDPSTGTVDATNALTQSGRPVLDDGDIDSFLSLKPEIGNGADLNLYRTTGCFAQRSTAAAYSGSHYPIATAGMLQVVEVSNMTFQSYHVFGLAGDNADRVFRRSRYNSEWSDWSG